MHVRMNAELTALLGQLPDSVTVTSSWCSRRRNVRWKLALFYVQLDGGLAGGWCFGFF